MSHSNNEQIVLLATLAVCVVKIKKKRKHYNQRRWWCKEWLMKGHVYSHTNLLQELRLYPEDWCNYLRMNEETYLELLTIVTPFINKQNTLMRKAITPHERLIATLRFLATGRNYEDLKFSTVISPQALGRIIPETCDAIYKALHKEYLKFPRREEEWKHIGKEFEVRWNFPNCLGALDGKHVRIVPPANVGSYYYNYKGYHSLVLMAIANANYEFILCDFGTNGRVSDGGVINNTKFYGKLQSGNLNIPEKEKLSNSNKVLPYVFVADDAFALGPHLLKPFPQTNLNLEKSIFNYRLSRARRIIENVFGILAARFRIFHTEINVGVERIEKIVMACCVLHNFLRRKCPRTYTPPDHVDHEEEETGILNTGLRVTPNTLLDLEKSTSNRSCTQSTKVIRENFMEYFNNEGAVDWQNKAIEK